MARERSPARDEAYKIYKKYKGNIDLVKIAEQLSVSPGTIRGWKNKDNWEGQINGTFPNNTERSNKKTNKKTIKKEPVADEVKQVLENTELTDKQRLFCIYYIKCFNATKAYQKAYGCSYETAMVEGSNSLRNPKIKAEIQILKEGKLNRALLSEDDIFQKYIDIAFADISDYLSFGKKYVKFFKKNEDGIDVPVIDPETGEQKVIAYNVIDLNDSKDVDTTIISEISEGKEGIRIKLHDKMKALQWLSDRLDLLPKDTQIKLDNEKRKLDHILKDNTNKGPIKIEFIKASEKHDK